MELIPDVGKIYYNILYTNTVQIRASQSDPYVYCTFTPWQYFRSITSEYLCRRFSVVYITAVCMYADLSVVTFSYCCCNGPK